MYFIFVYSDEKKILSRTLMLEGKVQRNVAQPEMKRDCKLSPSIKYVYGCGKSKNFRPLKMVK